MNNINDLLKTFGIKEYNIKLLKYFAFGNKDDDYLYKKININKSSGKKRNIYIPNSKLKNIQRNILTNILEPYWNSKVNILIKKHNVGFQKGKSIIDNAKKHKGKDIIIKIDLQDYFPSINQPRVFGIFYKNLKYNFLISSYLSGLCTYQGILPQGAPTSPILSNIISKKIDLRISKYISKINRNKSIDLNYSRYADDITISFNEKNYFKQLYKIEYISNRIFNIINEEGFEINIEKYRIIKNNHSQKVTGIIVNKKLSIGRKKFKFIKAVVNNINNYGRNHEYQKWLKNGYKANSLENFKSIIKGHISYYNMVNEYIYGKHLILNK